MTAPKPFEPRPRKLIRRGPIVDRVIVRAWPGEVDVRVIDGELTAHDARRLAQMLDEAADDADAYEWANPTDESLKVIDPRKADR